MWGSFTEKQKKRVVAGCEKVLFILIVESSSKTSFSLAFVDCFVFIQSNGTILLANCNAKKESDAVQSRASWKMYVRPS